MECNEDCSQVIKEKIVSSSLDLDLTDDKIGISCDSIDHDARNYIREGNSAYIVAIYTDDSWQIESLICQQCSVRDVMNRANSENHIAVVEIVIDVDLEDNIVEFQNPKIWELMKAE